MLEVRFLGRLALVSFVSLLIGAPSASAAPSPKKHPWTSGLEQAAALGGSASATAAAVAGTSTRNFEVLGHNDLGAADTNGDVFVHGNFAYVGTWAEPCDGAGVKVIDVSNLRNPKLIGKVARREGTSAEDMVVRHVATRSFTGDLMAVGIQRCGSDPALDSQEFGVELWNVTDPYHPSKLSSLGVTHGGGGVHELDLFQRGERVYALLATPFSEFFDPVPGGDFRIVDVTDPRAPVQVGQWGAFAHGLIPGPFWGIGSFGGSFDHSARASADGTKAYVSYWDLGVLTLDIRDVRNPVLITRTRFAPDADGDAHSVAVFNGESRTWLLQNDEDFDATSPTYILFGGDGKGIGQFSPSGPAVWLLPDHKLSARVARAANQGCQTSDYSAETAGRIAVVRTIDPFSAPVDGEVPLCLESEQEAAAESAGAVAVVHDFISSVTSPQWFDTGSVNIPVLFTDHQTAQGMVAARSATLQGQQPSWGFMRAFDVASGRQLAKFDDVANVHTLPPPEGFWSIHNNEVLGSRSYASWYSNGIVAIDLRPLNASTPANPRFVGQFLPEGGVSHVPFFPSGIPIVWGVAIRADAGEPVIFASDMNSGLWIVRPTGPARP